LELLRLVRGFAALSSGYVVGKSIGFVAVIALARFMPSEQLGRYATIITFVGYLQAITNWGSDALGIRSAAQTPGSSGRLSAAVLKSRVAVGVTPLIALLIGLRFHGTSISCLVAVTAAWLAFLFRADWLLLARGKSWTVGIWVAVREAVFALLSVSVVRITGSVESALWSYATAEWVWSIGTRWKLLNSGDEPGSVTSLQPRELIVLGFPLAIVSLTVLTSNKVDVPILAHYREDTEVAAYWTAYNIMFAAMLLSAMWDRVALATMSRQIAEGGDGGRGSSLHLSILGGVLGTVIALAEFATRSHRPLTYLVFPALIWAALRFGRRGATLAVAITALFTVWNTIHYVGPFHFESVSRSVLSAQLFIAVAALTTLSLAAVVSEREHFAARLGASRLRLVAAADNARRRLEQDLHDGAQLRLTWLAVQLRDAAELSRRSPERAAVVLGEAEGELELAIDELRKLAHGIHPAVLVDLGLAEAVKGLALHSSIPVTVVELPSSRLDETAETIAYYVVSEAIANAQKYSRASSIEVRIAPEKDKLRIEVVDDGVGGAAEGQGSGLEGLRDRAEAIGGTMKLSSRAGQGTLVAVVIPSSARGF